jgi:hypothetical protein
VSARAAMEALEDLCRAGWRKPAQDLSRCPPPALLCDDVIAGIAHLMVLAPARTSGERWRRALGLRALRAYGHSQGVEIMTYRGRIDVGP